MISIARDDRFTASFRKHIIAYNASLAEKCIREGRWMRRIKCHQCLGVFEQNPKIVDELIDMKKKSTDISYPCASTFTICELTEHFMAANHYDVGKYSHIVRMVLFNINLNEFYSQSNFNDHNNDSYDHKEMLVGMIIDIYY